MHATALDGIRYYLTNSLCVRFDICLFNRKLDSTALRKRWARFTVQSTLEKVKLMLIHYYVDKLVDILDKGQYF
jgi:hypothetical protein